MKQKNVQRFGSDIAMRPARCSSELRCGDDREVDPKHVSSTSWLAAVLFTLRTVVSGAAVDVTRLHFQPTWVADP